MNRIYHNPNDDLESGVWVGTIRGLEESVKYNATNQEKSWLTDLLSHNAKVISNAKRAILLLDHQWTQFPPPKIHAFYGLIVKWLGLLWKRVNVDKFGAGGPISQERYFASYQEFLHEGFTWLYTRNEELRMRWPDFFLSQRQNLPEEW